MPYCLPPVEKLFDLLHGYARRRRRAVSVLINLRHIRGKTGRVCFADVVDLLQQRRQAVMVCARQLRHEVQLTLLGAFLQALDHSSDRSFRGSVCGTHRHRKQVNLYMYNIALAVYMYIHCYKMCAFKNICTHKHRGINNAKAVIIGNNDDTPLVQMRRQHNNSESRYDTCVYNWLQQSDSV